MKPLVIAHRGRHKEFFENTLGAFQTAGKGNYFGIETDIHLTKDKKWIIHHDPDFLSNGKKCVIKDLNFDELIKLPLDNEFGIKDAYCPSFEEYLNVCKIEHKRPIIEIKPKNPSFKYLKEMLKITSKYFKLKDITVIAFYPWPLIKLRILKGKKIHLQHLVGTEHHELIKLAKLFKMDLDIYDKCLTQEIVDKFHKANLKVNVWTVDDKKSLERVINMGVDFVTSNEFNQED